MRVLITDGGGRGSTLVDKYGQSKKVDKILVVPGNGLMKLNTKRLVKIYPHLKTTSVAEILKIVKSQKIDLVDVCQDNAVEIGLVNELEKMGVAVVGPTKEAGQIEWDKAWARQFMVKYQIPHPIFHIFTRQKDAIKFLRSQNDQSWFIKASGLAEGKGALPAQDNKEAIQMVKQMKKFGQAGKTFLVEQWLEGEEFSAFALCDGINFKIVGYAQDHKRINNFDQGENTGGMGSVSNPLVININIKNQISKIFQKTVNGLRKENRPYKGVLYLGAILVNGKVYAIEFNSRWGDPEAEVILPSIKNDLYELGQAIALGRLNKVKLAKDKLVRVAVAGASKGYPQDYSQVKGKRIFGIKQALKGNNIKLYGAGVKKENGQYLVSGGRVLYTVGEGKDVIAAREKAYQAMSLISIEGNNLHFRTDIGFRDVERLRKD